MKLFLKTTIILSLSFICITKQIRAQTEYITVMGNQQMDTGTAFMQGFVHGDPNMNIPLAQKLEPAFWELGWNLAFYYDFIKSNFNTKITINISGTYMEKMLISDPQQAKPWLDNWAQWDAVVDSLIKISVNYNRPVDYWCLFGEPDNDFKGTNAQFIEMHRRTDSILKANDPDAKLEGPDFVSFGIGKLLWFIDSLNDVNVHLAGISWHEFGNYPEDVYLHVKQLRDSLAVRPQVGNPEIFIPEFADPSNRLIPGWNVGWIYYFEKSKLNWSSRACFDEFDGTQIWDDCWEGLSGMFMRDGNTPQPLYWLCRAYAALNKTGRLVTSSAQPRTVAMASKNDANHEMKILVGRYYSTQMGIQNPSADVKVKIKNYPYGNNSTQTMVIQKIPAQTVNYSIPLNNPVTVFTGTLSFSADSATIQLSSFADGDAYIIYINPDTNSVLSSKNISGDSIDSNFLIKVYPNPINTTIIIETTNTAEESILTIYNLNGQELIQQQIPACPSGSKYTKTQIDISTLTSGIYFVKLITDKTVEVRKIIKE